MSPIEDKTFVIKVGYVCFNLVTEAMTSLVDLSIPVAPIKIGILSDERWRVLVCSINTMPPVEETKVSAGRYSLNSGFYLMSYFCYCFIFQVYTLSLIHISEPTRRTPISYAVFCLKKKKNNTLISNKKIAKTKQITTNDTSQHHS